MCLAVVVASSAGRADPWQPAPGHAQVLLWPSRGASQGAPEDELKVRKNLVAGKPWHEVGNVVNPSLTVYPPKTASTRAAVIVFPGGGYRVLAIDLEGTEVCDWLTARGVTCVLLKYRVPGTGPFWDPACDCRVVPTTPLALHDAQRAMGLVRQHAAEWNLDPAKLGVLGFSAGGHLVAALSTHFRRTYQPVDEADALSCRPDFAIAIYPGHLWQAPEFKLASDLEVSSHTPPTLLVHASDDPVNDVNHSLVYYAALKRAKVPAELHVFAQGGHAFGLRRTELPITSWPTLVEAWLKGLDVL
jgi:acetyl esterase/lipase